jgi:hypothetical protein
MQRNRFLSPDDEASGSNASVDVEAAAGQPEAGADGVSAALAHAVVRYRDLVAATPGLVAEMVRGATIEEIDASVQAARQAYDAVSRHIAEQHEARISSGNPARSSADAAGAALLPCRQSVIVEKSGRFPLAI